MGFRFTWHSKEFSIIFIFWLLKKAVALGTTLVGKSVFKIMYRWVVFAKAFFFLIYQPKLARLSSSSPDSLSVYTQHGNLKDGSNVYRSVRITSKFIPILSLASKMSSLKIWVTQLRGRCLSSLNDLDWS